MQSHHKQGILCSSISDHFSVFHIAENINRSELDNNVLPPKLNRNISQRNIEKFIKEISNINWHEVMDSNDAQRAYNGFRLKLSKVYNLCFPLKPMKKTVLQ